jgi:protein phosphatase
MIKTDKAHLIIKASSHPGMTGKQNEDRFGVTAFQTREKRGLPSLLAVLCDGIGGQRAGEVAAEIGVEVITQTVAASQGRQPLKTLEEAVLEANAAILEAAESDMGRSGMGATCACAWVIDNRLYTTNLGDSRIYLLRGKDFIQLTTDHTWLQEAREAGILDEADVENHPNAHVIRRYLGSKSAPQPDFRLWYFEGESTDEALKNQGLTLEPGDTLLMCSDGLTDLVKDEEIRAILRGHRVAEIPDILIRMANERGGHDNITVVVLKVPPGKKGPFSGGRKGRLVIGCLLAILMISLLVTAILLGLRWQARMNPGEPPAPTAALTLTAAGPDETPPAAPTPTATQTALPPQATPRPSITPWPTDTPGP